MMPPPPSITDVSSASASFTAGAKMSGMNLAGPRDTPDFMSQLMSNRNSTTTTATLPGWAMPAAVAVAVLGVVVFVMKRKK